MLVSICITSSLFTASDTKQPLTDINDTLKAILAGKDTGNTVAQDPLNENIFAIGYGKKTLLIDRNDIKQDETDILSKAKVLENAYYGSGTMTKFQDQTSAATPSAKVTALAFNPANDSLLAQGREDGTIYVWDISEIIKPSLKKTIIQTLKGGIKKPKTFKIADKISDLEFHPNNSSKLIVTAGSTTQTFNVK